MNQSNCLKQKPPENPHKKPQQQTSHSTNKSSNFGENLLNKKSNFRITCIPDSKLQSCLFERRKNCNIVTKNKTNTATCGCGSFHYNATAFIELLKPVIQII